MVLIRRTVARDFLKIELIPRRSRGMHVHLDVGAPFTHHKQLSEFVYLFD